jgi:DNA-directed RNA polymerase specialized sigma24 family protein
MISRPEQRMAYASDRPLSPATIARSTHPPSRMTTDVFGFSSDRRFDLTSWTLVLRAQSEDTPEGAIALEALCRTYWFPLYAFVRQSGIPREDAEDIVQEFLSRFVANQSIRLANQERGKLRTFLLTLLKRFMINEWRKSSAVKRGGGTRALPLDFEAGECRYAREPATSVTAEVLFDRQWAQNLLERAVERLRADYAARGLSDRFERLRDTLWWNAHDGSYESLGEDLKLDSNAIKQAVKRLRDQYRKALRAEVAATLDGADEAAVSAELAELIAVLRRGDSGGSFPPG